jgi:hypothetical protein
MYIWVQTTSNHLRTNSKDTSNEHQRCTNDRKYTRNNTIFRTAQPPWWLPPPPQQHRCPPVAPPAPPV